MKKNITYPQRSQAFFLGATIAMAMALLPGDVFAHTGDLFNAEITRVENLFTGGYMRLGLLAVCGLTAIMGAIKQNAWMFLSGILSGVFAYFMRDWIMATFTWVI